VLTDIRAVVERDGFALLPGVFRGEQVDEILRGLTPALEAPADPEATMRSQAGVYGARNLLTLWPPVAGVWRRPPLPEVLAAVLGPGYGLVRVLFFDKPPERSWALPWHKDLTVAVRDNRLPSRHFAKPTRKAGVPHVEAPQELLEAMLTARVHLDDVTEENGPLKVIPGSHHTGKALVLDEAVPHTVLAGRGDVLLLRPLVAHSSGNAHPDTRRHRRILHLEFAGRRDLPDGYAWHDFLPG
jgi:Phytanoyl-CoA dioxygenase (PhyH)